MCVLHTTKKGLFLWCWVLQKHQPHRRQALLCELRFSSEVFSFTKKKSPHANTDWYSLRNSGLFFPLGDVHLKNVLNSHTEPTVPWIRCSNLFFKPNCNVKTSKRVNKGLQPQPYVRKDSLSLGILAHWICWHISNDFCKLNLAANVWSHWFY